MSKQKALSLLELAEVKQLVINGVQPQKIADQFKVGVSTIHNYKNAFKKEGLVFSSVRGRQAATNQNVPAGSKQMQPGINAAAKANPNAPQGKSIQGNSNTFVINGTSVSVSGNIKSVNIDKTTNGIVFEVTL